MSSKQILVVEKDALQGFLLEARLVESGWKVRLVTDPSNALRCCNVEVFNAAIINYQYSGSIDGFQLAKLLRERYRLPSLLITATRYAELKQHPLFFPHQDVLFKPYRLMECLRWLKNLTV